MGLEVGILFSDWSCTGRICGRGASLYVLGSVVNIFCVGQVVVQKCGVSVRVKKPTVKFAALQVCGKKQKG